MNDRAVAVRRLRAAGCVYAEREADEIWARVAPAERDAAVAARAQGVPLEQVVGGAAFGPVRVQLGRGVFVPRRRAEAVVLGALGHGRRARVVVDLGCGAGALAAWLAQALPQAEVHGVELDETAVGWARATSVGRFAVHQGCWWSGLPVSLRGRVDLAVAYLPHVPRDMLDRIHADFRRHEPALAVDGGVDGLDPLREILATGHEWLASAGHLVTLVADDQVALATAAARGLGWTVEPVLAGDASEDTVLDLCPPLSAAAEAARRSPPAPTSR